MIQTSEIRAYIDKIVAGIALSDDEQVNSSDGLIYCKNCGEPRQVLLPGRLGRPAFLPSCLCSCQLEQQRRQAEESEQNQRMERIRRRKSRGMQDSNLYSFTFANDNGTNPLMAKARAYVEHWQPNENVGLLLFGDVGTGKSFFAGCIANALLEKDVPVLMTNFPRLLLQMSAAQGMERCDFVDSLNDFALLIIDDLGAERGTEYVLEQMFQIIDSRWRSRKSMIITTNLTLGEIKKPA